MTRPRLATAALALLVLLTIGPAPVAAKVVHPFKESFNGAATPAGSFTPLGVAVDQTTHNIYVSDSAHKLIDKLSSSGAYLCQITGFGSLAGHSPSECDTTTPGPGAFASAFGQGIVESSGALLFPDASAHVDRFSAAGVYLSQLTPPASGTPTQVALDAAGNLYVADTHNHVVAKYTTGTATWSTCATGTPAGHFAAPSPSGVAVDTDPTSPSFGDVYVADPKNRAVDVFTSACTYSSQTTATPEGPLSTSLGKLATDPTDGHLFVPNTGNDSLDEFAPGGSFVSQTAVPAAPAASTPQGVALDPSSATLYVADKANNLLDVFATRVVPDVATKPATNVEEASATLNGEVGPDAANGGGPVTECEFEYVAAASYHPAAPNPYSEGETASCSPTPPYASPEAVSADVSLSPSTTYHYRLTAANANAIPSHGEDTTLTTSGPPGVGTGYAHVSGVNVGFKAKIDPFGLDTTCQVQYVEEAAYNPSVPNPYGEGETASCAEALGSGFGDVEARATASGLKVATTYHYRFLATNQAGTTPGADRTFITFGAHSVEYEVIDEEGHPYTQAGGRPYELRTGFQINRFLHSPGEISAFGGSGETEGIDGNLKDVISKLPPGLIGDPAALPKCTRTEVLIRHCTGAAQVGVITVGLGPGGTFNNEGIYNVVPPKGVAAEFAAHVYSFNIYIDARLRSDGDYGVTAESYNDTTAAGVVGIGLNLWGVPADPSHDALRLCPVPGGEPVPNCSANEPEPKPFLSNPTSCTGPLTTTLAFDSWQAPGLFDEHALETPPITGCNQLDFSPTLEARPTTNLADSPSGLSVDLHIPQNNSCNPDPPVSCGTAEANLKDTVVTLPRRITVNPAAASGLQACSSAQIGLTSAPGTTPISFSAAPPNCPDAAKIGTVEVDTPLLEAPLPGAVYIAAPHDNPFNSLLAIYIAIHDPISGVVVKLAGHVEADPVSGQLTASFEENPQLPFEDFKLDFFKGAHASLRTPPTCDADPSTPQLDPYRTTSLLTPWSFPEGARATPSDAYQITAAPGGGNCPQTAAEEPNAPAFEAGTEAPTAGAFSPFVLHLSREDGSQELKGINTTLPPGLTGKLAGVGECPQAQIEAAEGKSGTQEQQNPSCPLASQVGTVNVGAGAGPAPFYVQGTAYLSGPYKGAPLSLAIITPAVAGPFDLGTVVVKAALYVDPETAQITAKSDPLPTILQGIPLDVRSIALNMSRNQFTLNPTSCERKAVTGTATSVLGQVANLSNPFQVGGCKALKFKPQLGLRLKGAVKRTSNPRLIATLKAKPGEANIASAQVKLPKAAFLDQGHIGTICTRPQFAAHACPAASVYGTAEAKTPLLDQPLKGDVYLRANPAHKLPDLVADLNGQIEVALAGKTDSVKGALRNTFEAVPDAPVTSFRLELFGGRRGLIELSSGFCRSPRASVKLLGQNGKVFDTEPVVGSSCKAKGKKHGKGKK